MMDLVLSWAERRRAAGIATPLITPIVLLPPAPERPRRAPRARAARATSLPAPLSIAPSLALGAVEVAHSDGDRCAAAALSAEEHAAWDTWLDRTVKEIMGSGPPPISPPVAQDEDAATAAYLESAAAYVERVYRLRAYDAARDVEAPSAAPLRIEPPTPAAEPAVPPAAEPAPEEEPAPLVCRPAPPTREVLAARRGITHKDIKGDREAELIRRYQAGDRHAGEILLRAHAKAIAYWTNRYGWGRHDLAPEDLLAEGQLGFLQGVARFDPGRGFKILTYVVPAIRHRVQRARENLGSTIRVPVGQQEKLKADTPRAEAARSAFRVSSLDVPIGDEDGRTLGDLMVGEEPHAEERLGAEEERAFVRAAVAQAGLSLRLLSIVERRVLAEEPATLEELADDYGVTRERIRQLEVKAMRKVERAIRRLTPVRSAPR
jgi:RNA polymerase sigma factor (sigma-70 family)